MVESLYNYNVKRAGLSRWDIVSFVPTFQIWRGFPSFPTPSFSYHPLAGFPPPFPASGHEKSLADRLPPFPVCPLFV